MRHKSVLAIMAHPDDIEFMAAGTLLLLGKLGWDLHYLNLSGGDCGSMTTNREETRKIRETEAKKAASLLNATWYPPFCNDLLIFYNEDNLRRLTAVVRKAKPGIILTHSPCDYMEDHTNTSRLAVTAAFARGMPNFESFPPVPPFDGDSTLYHAMPHGLKDGMRQQIKPDLFVDIETVLSPKRNALAAHNSQKAWLDSTQGMDSYLDSAEEMSRAVGAMSGKYNHAEGWRRHLHLGFSSKETDPLADALKDYVCLNS